MTMEIESPNCEKLTVIKDENPDLTLEILDKYVYSRLIIIDF